MSMVKSWQYLTALVECGWQRFCEPSLRENGRMSPSLAITPDGLIIGGKPTEAIELWCEGLSLDSRSPDEALQKQSDKRVDLLFVDETAFDLSFQVPFAPLREMAKIIECEIQYRSPISAEYARWIWQADEHPVSGMWDVQAAVVLRDTLDKALNYCRTRELQIGRVYRKSDKPFSSSLRWQDQKKLLRRIPFVVVFFAIASVLLLTSLLAKLSSEHRALLKLEAQLPVAEASIADAVRIDSLLRTIDREIRLSSFKMNLAPFIAANLPDTAWLENLSIRSNSVEVSGYARSATEAAEIIGQIEGLADVRFASPVLRDRQRNTERFRISAQIEESSV